MPSVQNKAQPVFENKCLDGNVHNLRRSMVIRRTIKASYEENRVVKKDNNTRASERHLLQLD